jgi:ABC-type lipoprotein release transport system permease subunit
VLLAFAVAAVSAVAAAFPVLRVARVDPASVFRR